MHPTVRLPNEGNLSIYEYLSRTPNATRPQQATPAYAVEALISEEVERVDDSEDSDSEDLTTPLISTYRAGLQASSSREELWRSLTQSRAIDARSRIRRNTPTCLRPTFPKLGSPPEKCSLLNPGSVFEGKQSMAHRQTNAHAQHSDEWKVELRIQHVDWKQRSVYGLMKAIDVPNANTTEITTLFEGEILEDLAAGTWRASEKTDLVYWTRLQPFKHMKGEALGLALGGDLTETRNRYIFLRVKEVAFGDAVSKEAGLTIAGFYYVSLNTTNGRWDSLYHDPSSTPYQRLSLRRTSRGLAPSFSFR